jgi:hypothetical protein
LQNNLPAKAGDKKVSVRWLAGCFVLPAASEIGTKFVYYRLLDGLQKFTFAPQSLQKN